MINNDLKHVGVYTVLVVWETSSCYKNDTTTRSVSDPKGCFSIVHCRESLLVYAPHQGLVHKFIFPYIAPKRV